MMMLYDTRVKEPSYPLRVWHSWNDYKSQYARNYLNRAMDLYGVETKYIIPIYSEINQTADRVTFLAALSFFIFFF